MSVRALVVLLAATVATLLGGTPSAGATITGYVASMAVGPDGSVSVATIPSYGLPVGITEHRISPTGVAATPRALVPARRQHGWAAASYSGDGAVAAYGVKGKRKRSVIRAVIWGPNGLLGPAQAISDRRHGARGQSVVAGPNGAAAIVFMQGRAGRRWQDMIAVRPAGATRFARAVPLGRISGSTGISDGSGEQAQVVFAPDGSGAIAQLSEFPGGPLRLRRITRQGVVERAVTVARGPYMLASSDLAITPDGTIVAAFRVLEEATDALALVVSTLAPGATAATPLQKLGEAGGPFDDDRDLGLLLTSAGEPLLASGRGGSGRIVIFDGPATALRESSQLKAEPHTGLTVSPSGDGGESIFWTAEVGTERERYAIAGAHRPPGGEWTAPMMVTKPVRDDVGYSEIGAVVPVPGAGVVIAVQRPTGNGAGREVDLVRAP